MKKIFSILALMAFMAIGLQAQNNATLVKDIIDGSVGSKPYFGVVMNNILYFAAENPDPGCAPGYEIHRTDGTTGGTYMWREWSDNCILSGTGPYGPYFNKMFITVYTGSRPELWSSDGSDPGTVRVKSFSGDMGLSDFVYSGNLLYFRYRTGNVRQGETDSQLWKTDGTTRGTVLVKDFNSRGHDGVYRLMDVNGTIYFWADNGTTGRELWKSNGTSSGTVLVKDINPGSASSVYFTGNNYNEMESNFRYMRTVYIAVGNKLYFTATNGTNGYELWESDGTNSGTRMVYDLNPGSGSSFPFGYVQMGDYIYFCAGNGNRDFELYRLKVTNPPNNPELVKNINETITGTAKEISSFPIWLTVFNNALYFSAYHPNYGRELWVSDGQPGGTTEMLKDINFGTGSSTPNDSTDGYGWGAWLGRSFFAYGGWMYFSAEDGSSGRELWRSDGTADNTVRIADINENAPSSNPVGFTLYNGGIFFAATTTAMGSELWMFDPTNIKGPAIERVDLGAVNGISPNPASDYINITLEMTETQDVEVSVWSLCGKEMMNTNYPQRKTLNEKLDISALPAGTYLITIRNGLNIGRRKFIKI